MPGFTCIYIYIWNIEYAGGGRYVIGWIHGTLWSLYGTFTEPLRNLYGAFTEPLRNLYGAFTEPLWSLLPPLRLLLETNSASL